MLLALVYGNYALEQARGENKLRSDSLQWSEMYRDLAHTSLGDVASDLMMLAPATTACPPS